MPCVDQPVLACVRPLVTQQATVNLSQRPVLCFPPVQTIVLPANLVEKPELRLSVLVPVCYPVLADAPVAPGVPARVSSWWPCPSARQPVLQHDVGGALPPAPQHLHHHPGRWPLHPHAQPLVLLLHVQV